MKIKFYSDTDFREEVSRSFVEAKFSLQKFEAKHQSVLPKPAYSKSDIKHVEKKYATTVTNLQVKSSGIPEYSSELDTKFADVMQHDFSESKKLLTSLENGKKLLITASLLLDAWEISKKLHRNRDQY